MTGAPDPAGPPHSRLPVVVEQVRPEVTYDLRARVLRPGLPPLQARFPGDGADEALHYAAYAVATAADHDRVDRIVGVVAVLPESLPGETSPARRLRGRCAFARSRPAHGAFAGHARIVCGPG